jgi:hypothetical protein
MNIVDKILKAKQDNDLFYKERNEWFSKKRKKMRRDLTGAEVDIEEQNFRTYWYNKLSASDSATKEVPVEKEISDKEYFDSLRKDKMINALVGELMPYSKHFSKDELNFFVQCQAIDQTALQTCIELEKESAKGYLHQSIFNSDFLNMILWKCTSSYIDIIEKKKLIEFTDEHYIFRLACNDKANNVAGGLGYKFIERPNLLGWNLIKTDKGNSNIMAIDRINWEGSQISLALLVELLSQRKLITNGNPLALFTKYFTVKGSEITRASLKTNVDRVRKNSKAARDLPVEQRQLLKIITRIETVEHALMEIERYI